LTAFRDENRSQFGWIGRIDSGARNIRMDENGAWGTVAVKLFRSLLGSLRLQRKRTAAGI